MSWVVTGRSYILVVVPLSSHFRVQGLKRIADASLVARAAWTAIAIINVPNPCLPSVRLLSRTAMTYPVGHFIASASDFAGIQTSLVVQVFIPVLLHWMLAVCQKRVLLFGVGSVASVVADRASFSAACATVDRSLPLMSMLTIPYHNLAAADCVVTSSAWIFVAELGSYGGVFSGKRVVLTDISVGTEGTTSAIGPAGYCCLPFMRVAICTLITLPPRLFAGIRLDKSVPQVCVPSVVKLALQNWAEQACVWARLLVRVAFL